ncbi:MAG: class I SAM-dependent methyltransferase [Desulfobacterales bacterium]|jgi:23S rRNA (cytosine1962-C5)-methyltransferase|nr:class I SAM-dependent methyltransferase [Desulfobacterales bacterium]
MAEIILAAKREKSLLRRHPWVFSGAIAHIRGNPPSAGETVDIRAADGAFLGKGAFSPTSKIRVRVWTFEADEEITPLFFSRRLERALRARATLVREGHTGYRLVNAESDGLPGVMIDRCGDYLVGQFLTTGAEYWKTTIVSALNRLVPNRGIFERSDTDVRLKEGLPKQIGLLSGQKPPDLVEIREGAYRFLVDIRQGHKTGFYLDQRDNRAAVAPYAKGAEVLNCFSYTGGFAVAALNAGAIRVVNVDSSSDALALARKNINLNSPDATGVTYLEGDVFTVLRAFREENRLFDLIILDPPKFADSRQHLEKAARGYKDINLLAFKLLRPEGFLITFSCSGLMTPDLFIKTIAWAALDAGREAQILRYLNQASDHPTALNFPEASYLKGLICRVT